MGDDLSVFAFIGQRYATKAGLAATSARSGPQATLPLSDAFERHPAMRGAGHAYGQPRPRDEPGQGQNRQDTGQHDDRPEIPVKEEENIARHFAASPTDGGEWHVPSKLRNNGA